MPGSCEHRAVWCGLVWSNETGGGNNSGKGFRVGSGVWAARSGLVTAEAAVRGLGDGWGLQVTGMRPRCGAAAWKPGVSAGHVGSSVRCGLLSGLDLGLVWESESGASTVHAVGGLDTVGCRRARKVGSVVIISWWLHGDTAAAGRL